MKVVINRCFGGFGLSTQAMKRYAELAGLEFVPETHKESEHFLKDGLYHSEYDLERTDPLLIQVVEELGEEADGRSAQLKVVEIPDGIRWYIDNYDGMEKVAEYHSTWS